MVGQEETGVGDKYFWFVGSISILWSFYKLAHNVAVELDFYNLN
jgi:hypothetical protein